MRRSRSGLMLALALAGALATESARADDDALAQCIAASDGGLDLVKRGKLIEARKVLAACTAPACDADIRDTCQKRIQSINDALPTVVFAPKDGGGNDLEGVSLTIDGTSVSDRLNGTPIVIDPGEHEFRFELAGQPAVTKKLVLLQGEKNRRVEVVIGTGPVPAPQPAPPSAPPPAPEKAAPVLPAASEAPPAPVPGSAQRTEGAIWAAVGGAFVVVGLVFGGLTFLTWSSAQSECKAACGPGSQAQDDKNTAQTLGTLSDISIAAGGVLVGVGAYRWLSAPSSAKARVVPMVGPQVAGLSFRETF